MYLPLFLVVWVAHLIHASTLAPACQKGQFLKDDQCVPCSVCPANTYIGKSCDQIVDTVCTSFTIKDGPLLGKGLEVVPRRNATKERQEITMFKENATECFIKARKEDILIKGLIAALVIVTMIFIGYIIVTKCCQTPAKYQGSCDALITTVPEDSRPAQQTLFPEPNFVIGPDGTKIPEEQYLRNPMRALTRKGRSQALVSSPKPGYSKRCVYAKASAPDAVSLSSNSETSVTIDV